MSGKTFKLTGWKAVVLLVMIGAFLGFRFFTKASTLDTEGREVLVTWLQAEYARAALASLPQDGSADPAELEALGAELLEEQQVELTQIRARGVGDTVLVRVTVAVAGRPPVDGRPKRYYMMSHSMLTGWRVLRETTALRYYLQL